MLLGCHYVTGYCSLSFSLSRAATPSSRPLFINGACGNINAFLAPLMSALRQPSSQTPSLVRWKIEGHSSR